MRSPFAKAKISGTNDESIKYRDTLRDVETRSREAAAAIIDEGGTLDEAKAKYLEGREAIIESLEAKGLDRAEAERWADANLGASSDVVAGLKDVKDAVDDIPDKKAIKLTADTSDARSRVRDFIREYDGKTVTMTLRATQVVVQGRVYGGLRDGSYQGNFFEGMKAKHFASGGMRSGIYAGVQGGIFAEAERGVPWEAFISGRAADRERNKAIWLETGMRLGAVGVGSPAAGPSGVVELGPMSMRAIERLEVSAQVLIDRDAIGNAANAANASHAFRGGGGLG